MQLPYQDWCQITVEIGTLFRLGWPPSTRPFWYIIPVDLHQKRNATTSD